MDIEEMMEDWAKQKFTSKYKELSEGFDSFDKLCTTSKKILYIEKIQGNKMLLDNYIHVLLTYLSPIEQIFFLSWLIYKYQSKFLEYVQFFISPQQKIVISSNTYKADFCIEKFRIKGYKNEIMLENPVIIECDGYDSHSSKEQRNYDTSRENDLKMAGYSVIRFTGTQIYTDPYKCVIQTAKFVYDRNKIQIEKERKEANNGE